MSNSLLARVRDELLEGKVPDKEELRQLSVDPVCLRTLGDALDRLHDQQKLGAHAAAGTSGKATELLEHGRKLMADFLAEAT